MIISTVSFLYRLECQSSVRQITRVIFSIYSTSDYRGGARGGGSGFGGGGRENTNLPVGIFISVMLRGRVCNRSDQ